MDTRSEPPANRPAEPPPSRTVLQTFLEVAGDRVTPTTLRKSVLTGLCHTIEDLVVHDDLPAAVLTAFQDARHLHAETDRYERLADRPGRRVVTFARGDVGPTTRVRRFQLDDDHPLTREWLLVVLTDTFSAAVFGRELGERAGRDERTDLEGLEEQTERGARDELDRGFLAVWSFDPTVVSDVCGMLGSATASMPGDARRCVSEAVAAHPPRVPAPGINQRVTNAMFNRLDGGRRRWRDTARDLRRAQREQVVRSRRSEGLERAATVGAIAEHLRRTGAEVTTIGDLTVAGDLRLEPTDLGDWLEQLVDELRSGGTPVGLVGADSPTIDVDRERLCRAIVALIDNAVDAPGRIAPVLLELVEDETTIRVVVSDDGTGIATDLRMSLFDPMTTTRPGRPGGGLGLAIARRHVHDHGGSLELTRTGADGSVFVITLPRVLGGRRPVRPGSAMQGWPEAVAAGGGGSRGQDLAGVAGGAGAAEGGAAGPTGDADEESDDAGDEVGNDHPCALVVDDDPAIRELMASLLPRVGWESTAVADRERAIAAVADRPFDAILLDVRLGPEDGPAVLRELEHQRPGTRDRTAFLTGSPPADRRIDGRPVLGKPFGWGELERLLAQLQSG